MKSSFPYAPPQFSPGFLFGTGDVACNAYSSRIGKVTDKFGNTWGLMTER